MCAKRPGWRSHRPPPLPARPCHLPAGRAAAVLGRDGCARLLLRLLPCLCPCTGPPLPLCGAGPTTVGPAYSSPARLPACPPACLPACPPARLPACLHPRAQTPPLPPPLHCRRPAPGVWHRPVPPGRLHPHRHPLPRRHAVRQPRPHAVPLARQPGLGACGRGAQGTESQLALLLGRCRCYRGRRCSELRMACWLTYSRLPNTPHPTTHHPPHRQVIKGDHPLPGHLLSFVRSRSPTAAHHWRGVKAGAHGLRVGWKRCGAAALAGRLQLLRAPNGRPGTPAPQCRAWTPRARSAAPCTGWPQSRAWRSAPPAEAPPQAAASAPASAPGRHKHEQRGCGPCQRARSCRLPASSAEALQAPHATELPSRPAGWT